MKRIIVAAICLIVPAEALASPMLRCTRNGSEPFELAVDSFTKFGAKLTCFSGEVPTEGQACAPTGGFGMARPTGLGELYGITYRWQELWNHVGPVYGYNASDTKMIFTGGYKASGANWSDQWIFSIDRVSGIGIYSVMDYKSQRDVVRARFACRKVSRRF